MMLPVFRRQHFLYVVFIALRLSKYGRKVLLLCSCVIQAFLKKTQAADFEVTPKSWTC